MFEKGFCIKHGHGKIKLGTARMVYGATGQRKAVKPCSSTPPKAWPLIVLSPRCREVTVVTQRIAIDLKLLEERCFQDVRKHDTPIIARFPNGPSIWELVYVDH